MFPHTITIFNYIDKKYYKHVLENVYWYGSQSIKMQGNGIVNSNQINIVIPKENLEKYVSKSDFVNMTDEERQEHFTLCKNDRIVKGQVEDINSIEELNKYDNVIVVNNIEINDVGSDIDNILIGGK